MMSQDVLPLQQLPTPEHDSSNVSSPLQGVVLCCTSIAPEKRTELARQAMDMGAQHKYDLTSEVTHLIVGEYDTPKYRYVAKERCDVKVLKPEWIEAVRQLWISDKGVNVRALEREYTLPTFSGLRICMTGLDDAEQRQEVMELVRVNGGDYQGDLTKQITHLVVFRPEGAKYEHAKSWGLCLVSQEWLYDSLERGMILDVQLYHPEIPQQDRGKGAWTRERTFKSPTGKRARQDESSRVEESRRKLRRTLSTKLASQNEGIWEEIVGGGSTIQAANSRVWEQTDESRRCSKVLAVIAAEKKDCFVPDLSKSARRGTFSGCQFSIHGFSRKESRVLKDHLMSHDGHIVVSLDEFLDPSSLEVFKFVIVPYTMRPSERPNLLPNKSVQMVTDMWVERCLETKTCLDPPTYPLGQPFPAFPLEGLFKHTICSTGYKGYQLLHLSKAVGLLGGKYEEDFTSAASVLICDPCQPMRAEKLSSSKEWNIPVILIDWLLDSIKFGQKQPYEGYLIQSKVPKLQPSIARDIGTEIALQRPSHASSITRDFSKATIPKCEVLAKHPNAHHFTLSNMRQDRPCGVKTELPHIPTLQRLSSVTTLCSYDAPPTVGLSSLTPKKTASTASPPASVLQCDDHNTAISTIISKSISTNAELFDHHDAADGSRRKRGPFKIMGRAASNVSATFSRASSVDSTSSSGQAVIRPTSKRSSCSGRGGEDGQPPQTQRLQYADTESSNYKVNVMARMAGEKVQERHKEQVATIASLEFDEIPRSRKTRGAKAVAGLR